MSHTFKLYQKLMSSLMSFAIVISTAMSVNAEVEQMFKDVSADHYYYDAVNTLKSRGIIGGYADGTYRPQAAVTRGQVAKVLVRALNLKSDNINHLVFKDLDKTSPYYKEISILVEKGIMQGYRDHTFKPNDKLTRAQLAKILTLGYGFEQSNNSNHSFEDIPSNAWFTSYVLPLIDRKITTGLTQNLFKPNAVVTRGQLATFVYRAENAVKHISSEQVIISSVTATTLETNRGTYALSDSVKLLFTIENKQALIGAKVTLDVQGNQIRKVSGVEFNQNNSTLNANGYHFDGNITVNADNVELKNAVIAGNMIVVNGVQQGLMIENLAIKGELRITDANTISASTIKKIPYSIASNSLKIGEAVTSNSIRIQMNNVTIAQVNVFRQNVEIYLVGTSFIQEGGLYRDTKLQGDNTSSINKLNVMNGAASVTLNVSVKNIVMKSSQPVSVDGTGLVMNVIVEESGLLRLFIKNNFEKVVVTNANARVELGWGTNIIQLTIPSNRTIVDVIVNYSPLSANVQYMNGRYVGGNGESSSSSSPTNRLPTVIQPIVDQVGNIDTPIKIDLTNVFTDADGDALTYTADKGTITGKEWSYTPQTAEGGTTLPIVITANDGKGGTVTETFHVEVNRPPAVAKTIANQTVVAGNKVTVDLTGVFTDPDADALTYTADKGTIAGKEWSYTPQTAEGGTTLPIVITANDGKGGTVTETFNVEVNRPPAVAKTIANQTVVAGNKVTVDLTGVFTDPDADALTYTADKGTITGKEWSYTPQTAEGGTTLPIVITASDGKGGTTNTSFTLTVNNRANSSPIVYGTISEQLFVDGVAAARTFDLTNLFSDEDKDTLSFTATSDNADIVSAQITNNTLTIQKGSSIGKTNIKITAADGFGGTETYTLAVQTVQLATEDIITIPVKIGTLDPVTYNLASIFPGQTTFSVYEGNDTFIGGTATTLSGNIYTWDGKSNWKCIVDATGRAVVLNFTSVVQGPEDLYFSQYLDAGNGRSALQLFYNPVGDTSNALSGYALEIHLYNPTLNRVSVIQQNITKLWKGTPYIFINSMFYDFFDITSISYYNDEMTFGDASKYLTAFVLKKNGNVIDVLGDPNATTPFMPNGGTIIRKRGVHAGSSSYNLLGEWNQYPSGTFQYFGTHTP